MKVLLSDVYFIFDNVIQYDFFYKNTNWVCYNSRMATVSLAIHRLENRLYLNSSLYSSSLFKNGNIQQNRQVHFQRRLIDQCSQIFKMHKSKAALAFQNGFHTFFEQNQFPKICARLSLFLSLSLSMTHLLHIFTKLS